MNNTGHYIGCTCRHCIPGLDDRPYQGTGGVRRGGKAMYGIMHNYAIGDLVVTEGRAIPRRVKYIGATEVFLQDNDDPVKGEWYPITATEPYTVARGGKCVCPFCNYHRDLDRNKETA